MSRQGPTQPVFIVNPHSESGKTGKNWPGIQTQLKARFGNFDVHLTEGPGHATALTREVLKSGASRIVSVGGDGTLNEVLNGWLEDDQPLNSEAELGLIMRGTGGDFRKSLGLDNDLNSYLETLASTPARRVDIGKVTLTGKDGQPVKRYFINIGSFGMGGDVVHVIENSPLHKYLGGTPGFLLATLQSMARFRPQRVRLKIDHTLDLQQSILQVAVANGQAHGGGMRVAPKAQIDDGWFELIVLTGVGPVEAAMTLPRVYVGQHLEAPCVRYLRCRHLVAEALDQAPIWLEVDGESPGKLPATFELLPRRINLKA